ncbi:MAG: hypothetical protein Q8L29_02675 [archaeon]|nr:hypothetical protein [archaeon]
MAKRKNKNLFWKILVWFAAVIWFFAPGVMLIYTGVLAAQFIGVLVILTGIGMIWAVYRMK